MGQQAILPFELDNHWVDAPEGLAGTIYRIDDREYILVQNVEGAAIGGRLTCVWVSRTAFTVELGDAVDELPAGVTPDELAVSNVTVPDQAFFLLQISGDAEVTLGDTVTAAVAGEWSEISADPDGGKLQGRAPVAADDPIPQTAVGRNVDAQAATDGVYTIKLFKQNLWAG